MSWDGQITQGIDLIDLLIAAFAAFFFGLVVYLRREDKREGYAFAAPAPGARRGIIGWPAPPPPKLYRLMAGGVAAVPHHRPEPAGLSQALLNGQAIVPAGEPLLAALGAGASTECSDTPMRTLDGRPLLMPLRDAPDWRLRRGEDDPRFMRVLARDFRPVGRVGDLWVDRAAMILRYLEIVLDEDQATVLLPIFDSEIRRRDREIRVAALAVDQFRFVPRLADPNIMTAREEDRLTAFYAGAALYGHR